METVGIGHLSSADHGPDRASGDQLREGVQWGCRRLTSDGLTSSPAPTVSLYVNSYNAPALATYRRAGFQQVGSYATVLF